MRPHLFKFKPASYIIPGESLWAAVRYDEKADLYYWSVGNTAEEAYGKNTIGLYAPTRNDPTKKLKEKGWA